MVNLVKLAEEAIASKNMGEYFRIDVEWGDYSVDFKNFRKIADVEIDAEKVCDDLKLIVNSWARQGYFKIEKEWGSAIASSLPLSFSQPLSLIGSSSYIESIKFVYVSEEEIAKKEQEEKERLEDEAKINKLIELGILRK